MDGARLTVNPPTDQAFSDRVHALAKEAGAPEDLEALLRPDYPQVRVVRGVTDMVDRWYVYREGRWARS